jgi:hypothetical protein
MNLNGQSTERRGLRASWAGIAWLQGLNVLGVVVALGALLTTFCWMCDAPEAMSGGAKFALGLGIVALVVAPVLAARWSGRPVWLPVGVLALLTGVAGFLVGVKVFGEFGPALAVGLLADGGVAVRPPSRAAVAARVLAGAVVLAFAAMDLYLVVLVVLPAMGLADTIAVAFARPRPPDARDRQASPLQSPR